MSSSKGVFSESEKKFMWPTSRMVLPSLKTILKQPIQNLEHTLRASRVMKNRVNPQWFLIILSDFKGGALFATILESFKVCSRFSFLGLACLRWFLMGHYGAPGLSEWLLLIFPDILHGFRLFWVISEVLL